MSSEPQGVTAEILAQVAAEDRERRNKPKYPSVGSTPDILEDILREENGSNPKKRGLSDIIYTQENFDRLIREDFVFFLQKSFN